MSRHAAQTATADDAMHQTDLAHVQRRGFIWLRFPWVLEHRYQAHTAPARLRNLRITGWLAIVLAQAFAITDWMMVPDQVMFGIACRLGLLVPMIACWTWLMPRWTPAARERGLQSLSWIFGLIVAAQVVRSSSPLAPAYLISLSTFILVNGGMLRVRFWNALVIDLGLLAIYLGAVLMLDQPSPPLMISILITLVATSVFTLWGAYGMERNARTVWLAQWQTQQLQARLKASIEQHEAHARFDVLTGLSNRRHTQAQLAKLWHRAAHDGDDVAVCLMDVDHFKRYNDHHGHPEGDACLQTLAGALGQALQGSRHLVARWGGEEFLVVLAGADALRAHEHAQRLVKAVEAMARPHGDSPTASVVTLSLGLARARPRRGDQGAEELIAFADQALYQAKAAGRNRWHELSALEAMDAPAPETSHQIEPLPAPDDEAALAQPAEPSPMLAAGLAQLERNLPHFARPLELRFWRNRAAERFQHFLLTGVIALLVFNFFLPVDYLLANDVWHDALVLRLGVFTPIWALVIVVCWRLKPLIIARVPAPLHEVLVWFSSVMAGACLSYILAASHSPLVQYYHVGLMVVMLYGNLVQRLRFWFALASSAAIVAMHIHGAVTAPGIDMHLVIPMIIMLTFTGVFSLMGNHAIDCDDRRIYLLDLHAQALVAALNEAEARVSHLAKVDPLTGLYNRRHLDAQLGPMLQAAPSGDGVAAIMVDIDHFKRFNDHYGHPEGDACLRDVAQALASVVRGPDDFVARMGGEEFVVVLRAPHQQVAERVAERLRQAVVQLGRAHQASTTADMVTISLGLAWVAGAPQGAPTAADLLAQADAALYEAKHAGRNRWHAAPSLPIEPVTKPCEAGVAPVAAWV